MSFCPKCGKQLAPGEKCTCQDVAKQVQETAPMTQQEIYAERAVSNNPMKGFVANLLGTFKRPLKTAEEHFEKSSVATSLICFGFIVAGYLFVSLIHMIPMLTPKNTLFGTASNGLTVMEAILYPILWSAFMFGAGLGIYALINTLFIKKAFSFKKYAAFVTAPMGLILVSEVLAIPAVFVSGRMGIFFALPKLMASILIMFQGLLNLHKVTGDKYKTVGAFVVGALGMYLANYIVSYFEYIPGYGCFNFPI